MDSRAPIDGLKRGHIGAAGLDVYEEEEGNFFRDLSDRVLQVDVLTRGEPLVHEVRAERVIRSAV